MYIAHSQAALGMDHCPVTYVHLFLFPCYSAIPTPANLSQSSGSLS